MAVVHLVHELVKCTRRLSLDRHRREEQVHQHGLAAPDIADEIGAAARGLRSAEQAAGFGEVSGDAVEGFGGGGLQRIGG